MHPHRDAELEAEMIDLTKGSTPVSCKGCKYHFTYLRQCNYATATGTTRLGRLQRELGACTAEEWAEAIKTKNCKYWEPWRAGVKQKTEAPPKAHPPATPKKLRGKYEDPVTGKRYNAFDPAKAYELWRLELDDTAIARELGISHTTATEWRNSRGLPNWTRVRQRRAREAKGRD